MRNEVEGSSSSIEQVHSTKRILRLVNLFPDSCCRAFDLIIVRITSHRRSNIGGSSTNFTRSILPRNTEICAKAQFSCQRKETKKNTPFRFRILQSTYVQLYRCRHKHFENSSNRWSMNRNLTYP